MCEKILACGVIIAGILACVVCVIGLSIPFWYSADTGHQSRTVQVKETVYEGLFQRCTVTEFEADTRSCVELWDVKGDYGHTHAKRAVLAMCFIGMVIMICCVVAMVLHITCCGEIGLLPKIAGVLALVAGVFILIGVIVYATKVKDHMNFNASDLNAGFGLCLTSSIGCFIIGALCFFVD